MTDTQKELQQQLGKFFNAYYLSKAILEDYTKVIAKLEGSTEEEVKARVEARKKELWQEEADKLKKTIEEETKP